MSGQPYRYASDPEKYRAEYMRNLQESSDMNDIVLQAVKGYVSNGTLPGISQMPDTRTTAEKLLDVEKLKQTLVNDLKPVMETQTAQAFIQGLIQSPLNIDNKLVIFMAQRAPEIVSQLSKLYRIGIKGDQNDISTFVDFVNNMYNDKNKATTSIKGVLDRGIGGAHGVVGKEDMDGMRSSLMALSAEIDRYTQTIIGGPPTQQFTELILSIIERMSYISDHLPSTQQLKQYYTDMNSQLPGAIYDPQDTEMVFSILNFISEQMPNKNTLITLISDMNKAIQQFFNFTIRKAPKEVNMYQAKQPYVKTQQEIQDFVNNTLLQYAIKIDSIIPDFDVITEILGGTRWPEPQRPPEQYDMGEDEEQSDLGGPAIQGERGILGERQPTRMSQRQEEVRPSYPTPSEAGSDLDIRSQSSLGFTKPPSLGDYPEEEDQRDPFSTQVRIPQVRRGPPSVSSEASSVYGPIINKTSPRLVRPPEKIEPETLNPLKNQGPAMYNIPPYEVLRLDAEERKILDRLKALNEIPYTGEDEEQQILDEIEVLRNRLVEVRDRLQGNMGKYKGNGIAIRRRGRPKGTGFKQNIEQHIDTQKGIQPDFRFSKFGKYLIRNDHLLDNTVSIRNGKGLNVAGLPSTKSNPKVINIIRKIIGGTLPTFDEMNKLTEDEKAYLHNISKKSNILEKLNIPTPSKDKEEKDLHEFEVMKGEIMAGNDNKDMIKKFKALILKFSKSGTLPKQQVNEILSDLLDLGF